MVILINTKAFSKMASEDVIELGSSDDEAQPAFKKIKPTPNAMVHIPRKLHDVTIKPAKRNVSPAIPKVLAGKNVTVTKISKGINVVTNPYAIKNKPNGKPVQILPVLPKQIQLKQMQNKQIPQKQTLSFAQVRDQNKTVNPLSIMKKINSQVVINRVPSTPKATKNLIKVQSPRTINNLPPSITVTRTAGSQKRVAPVDIANTVRKKQKPNKIPKTTVGEVLTVDLDDDEVSSSSTASPQWYLRPEEQNTSKTIEEENNTEPEPSVSTKIMEEITIEDSPIKPIKDKRACEIASDLTVTIDDSPVKTAVEKNTTSGSDSEVKTENKVPHSKKKLEYPKEAEVVKGTVEIEIAPMNVSFHEEKSIQKPSKEADNIIEIEESPLKVQGHGTSTPKKNHPTPQLAVPKAINELKEAVPTDDLSEFHPVYQSFIKLCFQLENSDDMKKIVEKKIKTYYRQVPKEYTESEDFTEMVAGKVLSMKAGPEKMYLYIKDIVDELNLQRKMAKSQIISTMNEKKATDDKYYYGAEGEYDSKRQRQIRKLEKTLKKLHRAIQKLEEQEVDFDDEEDSVYLLTESDEGSTSNKDCDKQLEKDPKALLQRYKERMVRVHAKFCQLTNTKMPSEPRVQIDARPGHPSGPAKRLEKWINKKVPIGTPLPFPDFHDVLRCVRDANEEEKLGWNEADIMEEARDLFTRCGKKLQRRRQENEWRIAASRISVEIDPADKNKDLMKKLDDNKMVASKKEAEVFNKFADRQSQLKLEAEEIGDKEAEESPGDDDEEEDTLSTDDTSLENKEKRKERLKRLLQEKSIKVAEKIETKEDALSMSTVSKHTNVKDIEKDNEMSEKQKEDEITQEDTDGKKKIDLEKRQQDVEKLSENKEISENESIKTTDSDTVEMITEEKENSEIFKIKQMKKENYEKDKEINKSTERFEIIDNLEKAHSISDDSCIKLESDVDELHLLQKLHSENKNNSSTLDSSDSETPIAISDTLGSSTDSKKRASSDVISIENSSYSESETNIDLSDSKEKYSKPTKIVEEIVDPNTELECSNIGIEKKQARTNNDEYNESIEDILLASTDDEVENDRFTRPNIIEGCVNLKDDSLSIGDTVVEGVDKAQKITPETSPENKEDVSSVDSIALVSMKDDSPSQQDMDTESQDQIKMGNEETSSIEIKSVDKSEDMTLNESENSSHSVPTIELKESSSEKEQEEIEECGNTIDSDEKENSVGELMVTMQESIDNRNVEEKGNSAEEISDDFVESANSADDQENTNSVEEISDGLVESVNSAEEVMDTIEEPKTDRDIQETVNSSENVSHSHEESVNSNSNEVSESVEEPFRNTTIQDELNAIEETTDGFFESKNSPDEVMETIEKPSHMHVVEEKKIAEKTSDECAESTNSSDSKMENKTHEQLVDTIKSKDSESLTAQTIELSNDKPKDNL